MTFFGLKRELGRKRKSRSSEPFLQEHELMFAGNLTDADLLKLYLTLLDPVRVPGHVYALSCARVKIDLAKPIVPSRAFLISLRRRSDE